MKKTVKNLKKQVTLKQLADFLGCRFSGDEKTFLQSVASLEKAKKGDLTFLSDEKLYPLLKKTKASAVIVSPELSFEEIPALLSKTPYLTFIKAVSFFYPPRLPQPGIHPASFISGSVNLAQNVSVGPFSFIDEDVIIGDESIISALVAIGAGTKIGSHSVIHSHVSIGENIKIGNRVTIHSGAVIGADGFGYRQNPEGKHIKIPQAGTVIIEDDVEIGANTCIDRAMLDETIIRKGTKIDNLVQIAHNVEIDQDAIIVSQTGIAGSSKIGKKVILSGQVGVTDHVTIGDNVIAAAKTGITNSLPEHSIVSGSPHLDIKEWRKAWASIPRLYDLIKEIRKLKKRVKELENKQ